MATAAQANPGALPTFEVSRSTSTSICGFSDPDEPSLLGITGDMVSRAALFRGEWIGPWAAWLLLVLLLTAFPICLYQALRGVSD